MKQQACSDHSSRGSNNLSLSATRVLQVLSVAASSQQALATKVISVNIQQLSLLQLVQHTLILYRDDQEPMRSASRRQLIVPRVVAALSVLVLSPLRAQQFGILCLTVCVIQLLGLISFDVT